MWLGLRQSMQKFKIVFLGCVSCGKTSLITRFVYDTFETNYQATIGIDFLSKTLPLADRTIRLQLWDTAGQERFKSLVPSYIRDSAVAIVVYDMTDESSFEQVDHWVRLVREESESIILAIVANKSDLPHQITSEQGQLKAKEHNALFMECSAKSGTNVKSLFYDIVNHLPSLPHVEREFIELQVTQDPQTSCSC